jgi:hypothetical protein
MIEILLIFGIFLIMMGAYFSVTMLCDCIDKIQWQEERKKTKNLWRVYSEEVSTGRSFRSQDRSI